MTDRRPKKIGDEAIQEMGLVSDREVRKILGLTSESAIRTRMTRGAMPEPAAWARGYYWRLKDIEAMTKD